MTIEPPADSADEPTDVLQPLAQPAPLRQRPGFLLTVGAAVGVVLLIVVAFVTSRTLTPADDDPGTPVVAGPAGTAATVPDRTRLEQAKDNCAEFSLDVTIGDDGASLIISRAGAEERPGATILQAMCVLYELDVPDAVVFQIEGTRALDGRQHADWDGISASWTYHPDNGLNMILQEEG